MDTSSEPIGSVVALWRYPVKSMQGEELNGAAITEHGILGDRAYALREQSTGYIASAKHPRKWGKLFACRAAFVEPPQVGAPLPPVWITLPDGSVIHSAQPNVDQILSRVFGRGVALVTEAPPAPTREADRSPIDSPTSGELIRQEAMALAAPTGTFFDYASLHILTTATIERLRELCPTSRFEVRRFRPNIVVAPCTNEPDFVENAWLDHMLTTATGIRLRLIDPCPRCVVTTLAQSDLPHDPDTLRTVGRYNAVSSATLAPGVVMPAVAGIYASVLQGGVLCRGDSVWVG